MITTEQQAAITELAEVAQSVLLLYENASAALIERKAGGRRQLSPDADALTTAVRVLQRRVERLRRQATGEEQERSVSNA